LNETASYDYGNSAELKLQTVGGLLASALARQQVSQQIEDAFSAFNKFLESPADPGLVDFVDR
jgi:hypothetical protein